MQGSMSLLSDLSMEASVDPVILTASSASLTSHTNDIDDSYYGDLTLDPPATASLEQVRTDLYKANAGCQLRGLWEYSSWISEQLVHLPKTNKAQIPDNTWNSDYDLIMFALQLMHTQEYARAVATLKDTETQNGRFLFYYCKYLSGEKSRIDKVDVKSRREVNNEELVDLRIEMEQLRQANKLDTYGLWLLGVILSKSALVDRAILTLVESLNADPSFWGSWKTLAKLIKNKNQLQTLPSLPHHWMKNFFYVEVCQEMYYANDALSFIQALEDMGLTNNPYLLAKRAEVHYALREYDIAKDTCKELLEKDPNRLDIVDMYSNILYVKEDKAALNYLAHHTVEVDKYRPETCCVVGNFYSIYGNHDKAITYFQRALRLDPDYLSAWTLMGHEYVELKNYNMAIECYRNAIDVNPRDYRAWYGIGQTYELLKMHAYCLYYYMEAQRLRPTDSRMIVALGESYEKLEQPAKAKKCYMRALNVGDQEDIAMIRLAKVCEKLHDEEGAVRWYSKYVDMVNSAELDPGDDICFAYRYLAHYYLRNDRLPEADVHAHKCCEFKETKNDGKALVRQIAAHRNSGSGVYNPRFTPKPNLRVKLALSGSASTTPGSQKRSRTPPPQDHSDNDMSF
ncbi:cell division cycle protein 23 homolog [Bolinopsis microptera]|uniref:cell division cycle protein 23 homolog n=1 Tax=Bolinopsis microptera TaxID=2820187 RepID=UPI003078DF35